METDRLENILRDVLALVGIVALIVISFENGQRTGQAIGQIKELRQSMEDAGYVTRQPEIREAKQ